MIKPKKIPMRQEKKIPLKQEKKVLTGTNKAIIFDASTIISISMNGLVDEFRELKKIFNGRFIITKEVKGEVLDKPIKIKRFELEALRVKQMLDEGVLEMPESVGVNESEISNKTQELLTHANGIFESSRGAIKIIHLGEASCLALSKLLTEKNITNVLGIDERTMRMLIEKPENLKNLLEKKMHTKINLIKQNFEYFKGFKLIRSTEIMYVAYKKGLIKIKDGDMVLDAILYGLKFKGCSISNDEIEEIKRMA